MSYQKVEFEDVYQRDVGGFHVFIGHLSRPASSSPTIFAAALSERELRREGCGYGTTEAEAVTDLFRLMRPGPADGLAGLLP